MGKKIYSCVENIYFELYCKENELSSFYSVLKEFCDNNKDNICIDDVEIKINISDPVLFNVHIPCLFEGSANIKMYDNGVEYQDFKEDFFGNDEDLRQWLIEKLGYTIKLFRKTDLKLDSNDISEEYLNTEGDTNTYVKVTNRCEFVEKYFPEKMNFLLKKKDISRIAHGKQLVRLITEEKYDELLVYANNHSRTKIPIKIPKNTLDEKALINAIISAFCFNSEAKKYFNDILCFPSQIYEEDRENLKIMAV